MTDYQKILNKVGTQVRASDLAGKVADYIPELAHVPEDKFGMHLSCINGGEYGFGNSNERFSIQSISKVPSLTLALLLEGERVWERVGVEPSGDPFNSLVQLEYENGIPRNPFINAGALVVCDILFSHLSDPKTEYQEFICQLSGNADITYDENLAASEKRTGHNNRAMINLMKGYGNIQNDVEDVLDFYFHTCSIAMSCQELANMFMVYANHGKTLKTGKEILSAKRTKRINALMQTCGFYDEAGEFSFRVGLPGKSGVGGGIVAIYPNMFSTAIWSPKLNEKGNSTAGMVALEMLTDLTGRSIF